MTAERVPRYLEGPAADPTARTTLLQLLESPDAANNLVALELMKTGGCPPEAVIPLLLLCQDVRLDPNARTAAKILFHQHAPEALQEAVRRVLKTSLLLESLGETKRAERITALDKQCESLDGTALAFGLLKRANVGTKYLFELGQPDTSRRVLQMLSEGTSLRIDSRELTELPAEILALPEITEINARSNDLGMWPKWLGELPHLDTLDLTGNRISHIPSEPGAFPRLRRLRLGQNHLKEFPQPVCQFTGLVELDLSGESYSQYQVRNPPDAIGDLTELRELTFHTNLIDKFPASMRRLTRLESLNLIGCGLGPVEDWWGNLTALKDLNAAYSSWDFEEIKKLRTLLPNCYVRK